MEANLYTMGDSAHIDTWSNLPYFFSKALEAHGVRLNRIDILPQHRYLYRAWQRILNKVGRLPCHDPISIAMIQHWIEKETLRYPHSSLNIFLTFSFTTAGFSSVPVVSYCDQVYELFLEDTRQCAGPIDRLIIAQEKRNLQTSACIFTTGTRCRDFIRERYGLSTVQRLRTGINLDVPPIDTASNVLPAKRRSKNILFIGKGLHKRGVDILLEAFRIFNGRNGSSYTLHLVGSRPGPEHCSADGVRCHGYLSKSRPLELAAYLDLLRTARLFVMPMREGPPPGVVFEAALLYTPIVITNIWGVNKFVRDGVNGVLVGSPNANAFADCMDTLANDETAWETMARNAHRFAKRYSWDHTGEVFLKKIYGACAPSD